MRQLYTFRIFNKTPGLICVPGCSSGGCRSHFTPLMRRILMPISPRCLLDLLRHLQDNHPQSDRQDLQQNKNAPHICGKLQMLDQYQ